MKGLCQTVGCRALTVAGVAAAWVMFFNVNIALFAPLANSPRAHWIFLPAALRVLSVLLFDGWGAAGLMVGAYFTLSRHGLADLPGDLLIAASSALAPLVGIAACRRWLHIAWDLSGLRGLHIIAVSVATAAANAVILNLALAAAGQFQGNLMRIATVFVGDVLGTAIMLSMIAAMLSLITRRVAKQA
ncbi:MAG: hypothetical protein RLZZ427_425 [Pseudomonadota bacterium]